MKGPKIEKLDNEDLNEFRDELFIYLAMLFDANSKALAKTLENFLCELRKILISLNTNKSEKGKNSRGRKA